MARTQIPPPSSTAREALVAELLGDVGCLLDRVDALSQSMREARKELQATAEQLMNGVEPFRSRMARVAEGTLAQPIKDIERKSRILASDLALQHSRMLAEKATELLVQEVRPALGDVIRRLEAVIPRVERPWVAWASHMATALLSSAASTALAFWLLR